jgi:hypothetical protein
VDAGDDERKNGSTAASALGTNASPARAEHGRRSEVLADPASHEEVLVPVRVQQCGVMLHGANDQGDREQRGRQGRRLQVTARHVVSRRRRDASTRKPAVSADR